MALYRFEATDSNGRPVRGSLEAKDEGALVIKLREMGYLPIEVGRSADTLQKDRSGRVSARDIANFTQALSGLLEAGFPLDKSLSILAELESKPAFNSIILVVKKGIEAGRPFSDCLSDHPKSFSPIYVSMVRAGEAGGALDSALGGLYKYLEEGQRVKDEIRSALIYPALLLVAGGSAIFVMLFFVAPSFTEVFADTGSEIPLPAKALLFISRWAAKFLLAVFAALALSYIAFRGRLSSKEGRLYLDALKLKLPVLGGILKKAAVSRFARTLGALLQGGTPLLNGLGLAIDTTGNLRMAKNLTPVIEGVRKGKGFSGTLKDAGFPPLALHMITIGEETGRLDEMLLRLSDTYDREIGVAVKRLLSLLEPAIILVMSIVVGAIVITLLTAIMSVNDMRF